MSGRSLGGRVVVLAAASRDRVIRDTGAAARARALAVAPLAVSGADLSRLAHEWIDRTFPYLRTIEDRCGDEATDAHGCKHRCDRPRAHDGIHLRRSEDGYTLALWVNP